MDKEDKQIIDRAVKEEWRIGDRSRLKRLLEKNLKLYRENEILEGCLIAEQEHTQMLEQQIEKMKCCSNCKHFNKEDDLECCQNCERQLVNSLDNLSREEIIKDEWEIKENE